MIDVGRLHSLTRAYTSLRTELPERSKMSLHQYIIKAYNANYEAEAKKDVQRNARNCYFKICIQRISFILF